MTLHRARLKHSGSPRRQSRRRCGEWKEAPFATSQWRAYGRSLRLTPQSWPGEREGPPVHNDKESAEASRRDVLLPVPGIQIGSQIGRCLLSDLPPELLLRIMRLLVPTKNLFYICDDFRGAKQIAICQLGTRSHDHEHRWHSSDSVLCESGNVLLTSVASTCRFLNDTFNAVLYGENSFVLDIGSPEPVVFDDNEYSKDDGHPRYSNWYRKFAFKSRPGRCATWPLTRHTLQFVRNLTVCRYASQDDLRLSRPNHFPTDAQKVAEFLSSAKLHLRYFHVHLGVAAYGQYVTFQCYLDRREALRLRLPETAYEHARPCTKLKIQKWWQSWGHVGGAEEIKFTGIMEADDQSKSE